MLKAERNYFSEKFDVKNQNASYRKAKTDISLQNKIQ